MKMGARVVAVLADPYDYGFLSQVNLALGSSFSVHCISISFSVIFYRVAIERIQAVGAQAIIASRTLFEKRFPFCDLSDCLKIPIIFVSISPEEAQIINSMRQVKNIHIVNSDDRQKLGSAVIQIIDKELNQNVA